MPALVFYRGNQETLRFPLTDPQESFVLKIGRHPSNDLTLPDEEVSRFHANLEVREGKYWVVDQSLNGTFLNGSRVREQVLRNQDALTIGLWKIVFLDEAVWGEKETIVQKKTKPIKQFQGMIGQSTAIQKIFSMIEKVAPTTATVLVLGETGTGKELIARAIHQLSPRAQKPFIAINCGAISPQLIESELFGHERGAFTGALNRHLGAFEQARGGTLFLDEIGELPLELQPKLLRVLEEQKFRRVGGSEELAADVRIVAATHRNLESQAREGKFREDLYFRLYSVPIILPPLRERSEDIPLLVDFFAQMLQSHLGESSQKTFSPESVRKLANYSWRGNIRELKNVITRTLLFATTQPIDAHEILFLSESSEKPVTASLQQVEKEAIMNALKTNNWNKKKTADVLGIAKSTLFHKLKEYDIQDPTDSDD